MRSGRPRKEVDEELLIREYSDGVSSKILAVRLGVSISTIIGILKKNNIQIRSRGSKGKFVSLLKEVDIEKIIDRYVSGESAAQIALDYNVKHHMIEKWLKERGIAMRGMTAYNNINESYFRVIDSEEKAYWIGFIAADGNIYKPKNIASYQISIDLAEKDIDHLRKFKYAISSTSKLYYRKDRKTWSIIFKSRVMWENLRDHGIIENKSKVLEMPNGIPILLERHFWRGLTDGDGSIFIDGSYQIVGSRGICFAFVKFCKSNNIDITEDSVKEGDGCYRVCLYGANSENIINILYGDCSIFLDRKNIAAKVFINMREDGIIKVDRKEAEEFLAKYHYLGTLPAAVTLYGWILLGKLVGVAAVGSTSSVLGSKSIGCENYRVCELRRFALVSGLEKNSSSMFLSKVIKRLKLEGKYVAMISYADSQAGHTGVIYQACGAKYLGCSKISRIILPDGRVINNGRYLFDQIKDNLDKISSSKIDVVSDKHKYVFVLSKDVDGVINGFSKKYPVGNVVT